MKKLLLLTIALTIFVSGCKQQSNPVVPQKPIVKIGVVCPLTGNLAFYGIDLRDGILLAQKELENNTKFDYQIIVEDDQFDNKRTMLVAQKLINTDKVDCLITMFSNAALLINPITEKNKIIHFSTAYDPAAADGLYNFNHWPRMSGQVELAVQHLRTLPYKKIGVLMFNQEGAYAALNELKRCIGNEDISIVFEGIFNQGERDFLTLLTKAKNSDAEIFFIVTTEPELEILMKQMRNLDIQTPVFSLNDFRQVQNLALFENAFYADRGDPTETFSENYAKQYDRPSHLLAPHGYDILNIIVHAYENSSSAQKPSSEQIARSILASGEFNSALGKARIDDEGVIESPLVLRIIKNDQRIILE